MWQGVVHKIDGTRDVEEVWADTVSAVTTMEQRFSSSETVYAHVYSDAASTYFTPATLAQRVEDAAAEKFGPGKVKIAARGLKVDSSTKAFGLNMLPAFD